MNQSVKELDQARHAMVDDLRQRRLICTPAIEEAFRAVPRHAFTSIPFAVAADPLGTELEKTENLLYAYIDAIMALEPGSHIGSAAPSLVAQQLERLGAAEGMRVLHIATGSGYCSALIAELVGERGTVVGVEHTQELAQLSAAFLAQAGYTTVTLREGDGALGVPEAAPFDRILVSAAVADIAPQWVAQLANDGRLVLPLGHSRLFGPGICGGIVLAVDKSDDLLLARLSTVGFFAPLQGAFAPRPEDGALLADGLARWSALEDFLRTDIPIRIAMKGGGVSSPHATSVPWLMETRHAVFWVEPN